MHMTRIDYFTQGRLDMAVELAEEALSSYLSKHYGPLWGETNEQHAQSLRAELVAAYEAAGTPEDDRRIDV